jgi:hypothetical protein
MGNRRISREKAQNSQRKKHPTSLAGKVHRSRRTIWSIAVQNDEAATDGARNFIAGCERFGLLQCRAAAATKQPDLAEEWGSRKIEKAWDGATPQGGMHAQ